MLKGQMSLFSHPARAPTVGDAGLLSVGGFSGHAHWGSSVHTQDFSKPGSKPASQTRLTPPDPLPLSSPALALRQNATHPAALPRHLMKQNTSTLVFQGTLSQSRQPSSAFYSGNTRLCSLSSLLVASRPSPARLEPRRASTPPPDGAASLPRGHRQPWARSTPLPTPASQGRRLDLWVSWTRCQPPPTHTLMFHAAPRAQGSAQSWH